jgi:hypothetical protein
MSEERRNLSITREEAVLEALKMSFEATKQVTTLNAGSIVLIGTFLSNIFPANKHGVLAVPFHIKLFIGVAFLGFGASLLASTIALIGYRGFIETRLSSPGGAASLTQGRGREQIYVTMPLLFFTLGLICFGVAVLLNLFFGG